MPEAQLDVVINSIANTAGFTAARAELATLGGGTGGAVRGGAFAGAGVSTTATKELAAAERDLATEGNAVARAASSMGIAGAEAGGRLAALGGVLSSSGALGLGVGAAIIGLGAVYEIGKSVVDNVEAQDSATRSLSQAYGTLGEAVPTKEIQDFIDLNSRFIPNMFSAEQGFASLARAGFDNRMQLRLMNDALDLSAASGRSLDDAIRILTSSSTGMSKGLLDLGVSQKDVNHALGSGATESQKFEALLKLLEPKIKDARDTTGGLAQSTNRLNTEWQHLTSDNQPLPGFIQGVENKTADFLGMLANSDQGPNSPWAAFQRGLVGTISLFEVFNQMLENGLATGSFTVDVKSSIKARPAGPGGPSSRGASTRAMTTP